MRATNNIRPVDTELVGTMDATATTGTRAAPFEPSLWDDYFVTYTPPASQACPLHFDIHARMYNASTLNVL
jgi:hypothetical protein